MNWLYSDIHCQEFNFPFHCNIDSHNNKEYDIMSTPTAIIPPFSTNMTIWLINEVLLSNYIAWYLHVTYNCMMPYLPMFIGIFLLYLRNVTLDFIFYWIFETMFNYILVLSYYYVKHDLALPYFLLSIAILLLFSTNMTICLTNEVLLSNDIVRYLFVKYNYAFLYLTMSIPYYLHALTPCQ